MHRLLLVFSLILSTSLHAATGGGLVADNTAGTLSTLQDQTYAITGGTVRGGNLLHSFREFNVETGQTADFQAAADTQNIVSRVTGPNDSWIDGQIKSTTSDANLYLVNPNGIVMGQNASLDVNGAFHATTADYVTLADGERIYADAGRGVTLTVAAPAAFGFLDASVGKIQINGSQLHVAEGQAISLVGGEIDITSGAELQAAGGRIDLVGVASAGEVQPTPVGITHTTTSKADISLTDSTVTVDNHADSKTVGTIRAQGANITANNSRLWTDNNSAVDAVGHSVELSATEDIRFTGSRSQITAIANSSGKGGSVSLDADNQIAFSGADISVDAFGEGIDAGDAGNVTLKSRGDILFTDVAQLSAVTKGSGQGGDVTLTASGQVYFSGTNDAGTKFSGIFARTESTESYAGAGGKIIIQASDIEFAKKTRITVITRGPGQGGSVMLDADSQITFQGGGVFVHANGTGTTAGDAGDLTLKSRGDIRFTDNGQLGADTKGAGRGGNVSLTASGQVYFAGAKDAGTKPSGIFARTESTENYAGVGGEVTIQASDIEFAAGSQISVETSGSGQGGSVMLDADNQIAFQSADIFVGSYGTGANAGDAGDLTLQSHDIRFTNVAQLHANTSGVGKGGDVTLIASGRVYFAGANNAGQPSGIFIHAESTEDDAGSGGKITIQASDIKFVEGAQILATTNGSGQGGDVILTTSGQVYFAGTNDAGTKPSGIFARTASIKDDAGSSGTVTIQASDIKFTAGAQIAAETSGSGQGGSAILDADNQIAFQSADIFVGSYGTSANSGDAGDLTLKSRGSIRFTDGAQLGAHTSGVGQGGDVTLTTSGQVYFAGTNDAGTVSSGIFARAEGTEDKAGAGGRVTIQAQDIEFVKGARISAFTRGPGQGGAVSLQAENLILAGAAMISSGSKSTETGAGSAGNLRIITGETIELSGGSALTTESENAGGGGIHIETRDRLHLQDSKITTSVKGGVGQGGNIFIDPIFVILENSQIQANAYSGPGGNIILIADYLMRSGPTAIEASSALSTPGNIDVQAVDVDAGSLQVADTPDPLDVTQWVQAPCHRHQGKVSRLTMAGYDAHPTPMDDLLSSLPLRALRPTEPLSVPTSAVHQTRHNLLAATHLTTGCSWL